ncbi:YqhR family membrane protein [Paenibacillus sp. BSR1-1]|uniref:YqhR family membrane protein n=1 Tax=Paenibacillus sp. BSR1-1 TaxID=3020845 RepID=UPI0025B04A3D|nr:YqhR family membrane protein [Paenibacillus sp. BSR1-1]MDN3016539.1 YqhR family membrane protein [Paenibacillus sp. BSR1-1]
MANILKTDDYPKPMSFPVMVFWTGLFGGVFWGFIGYLANYLSFTEIHPNVILGPWAFGDWKTQWQGTVISLLLLGIISVVAAFIYYFVLRKLKGFWFGIIYGLILYFLVFFVLNPLFPGIKPFFDLSRDTIITSICIYIVYGIFIGYSINYEYQNNIAQENEASS